MGLKHILLENFVDCPYIQATFPHVVTIIAVDLGIGNIRREGWNQIYIQGAAIESSLDGNSWTSVATAEVPTMNTIHEHRLPKSIKAKHMRLRMTRVTYLAVSFMTFR